MRKNYRVSPKFECLQIEKQQVKIKILKYFSLNTKWSSSFCVVLCMTLSAN